MKKLFMICIILAIAVSSAWSQPVSGSASSQDSRVMIVNAYSKDIYIEIVDATDNLILETSAISSNAVSRMMSTPRSGFYFINYRYNETDDWQPFYDEYDDDDYLVQLQAGLVCCVLIDGYGGITENTLVLPVSDLPVVCFCNISQAPLNRMEIGTEYLNTLVAFTTNLESLAMTDFTTVQPGNYGLFWETVESGAKDEFTFLSYDDDTVKLFPFANSSIYAFCVYKNNAANGVLYNITPQ